MAHELDEIPLSIMECPGCGRLWVGTYATGFECTFTTAERDQLTGFRGHACAQAYMRLNDGWPIACRSIPQRVHRPAVEAAYLLAGKDAAEELVDGALRASIEAYERQTRDDA